MPSPLCDEAVTNVLRHGRALLKFITPNEVGLTGGHQKGFYIPKPVWNSFTPFPPTKGVNNDHPVEVSWYDGRVTRSTVKWYGTDSRSEYRLTGFNRERGFPHISPERVGSLLVLVPERIDLFHAFVLESDDDVTDLQAGLGIEVHDKWAFFDASLPLMQRETEDECLSRRFEIFAQALDDFPVTAAFAQEAREGLLNCALAFASDPSDKRLSALVDAEYRLFRMVERKICTPVITQTFATIDDFLAVAQSVLQRRKSRAGKSLEHHVEYLLRESAVPFVTQPEVDGTRPDILIPGKAEYVDPEWPVEKLFVLGLKTTCKDRWRQVIQEAPRIPKKHILTLQNGISVPQMEQMKEASVALVVPKNLHDTYPPTTRGQLLTVEAFIQAVRERLDGAQLTPA